MCQIYPVLLMRAAKARVMEESLRHLCSLASCAKSETFSAALRMAASLWRTF